MDGEKRAEPVKWDWENMTLLERARIAGDAVKTGTPINEVRKQFGLEPLSDDGADESLILKKG